MPGEYLPQAWSLLSRSLRWETRSQHDVLGTVAQRYLIRICGTEFRFGGGSTCSVWAVGMLINSHDVRFRYWMEKAEILKVAFRGAVLG